MLMAISFNFFPGVKRDHTSRSANLQLYVWIFNGIIMANVYTGFLVASITACQAPPPFTDLKTMVKQTEYTFGMMRGSAFFRWMNVSEEAKQMKNCYFQYPVLWSNFNHRNSLFNRLLMTQISKP